MYISIDPGIAMTGSLAACAWKGKMPVAYKLFRPDQQYNKKYYPRYRDLCSQLGNWMLALTNDYIGLFKQAAIEEFVSYRDPYKNKSLDRLNEFKGYLACYLHFIFNVEVIECGKGELSKHMGNLVIEKKYSLDPELDQNIKDAIFIGYLAGYGDE